MTKDAKDRLLLINNLPTGKTNFLALEMLKAHQEKGGTVACIMPEVSQAEIKKSLLGIDEFQSKPTSEYSKLVNEHGRTGTADVDQGE